MSNSDGRAGMAAVAGEIDIEHLAKVNLDLTSSSWWYNFSGSAGKASFLCPASLPEASLLPGHHWHLQAQEKGASVRGLWSKQNFWPSLPASSSNKVSFACYLTLPLLFFSFRKYVPLDSSLYQEVEEGKIRLWILFHPSEPAVWPWRSWRTLQQPFGGHT